MPQVSEYQLRIHRTRLKRRSQHRLPASRPALRKDAVTSNHDVIE